MGFDWGPIPKSSMIPVVRDGVRRINGRQVNLVIALGIEAGKMGDRLLEWIQFECGVNVDRLEDIPDGPIMQKIVASLKGDKR